MFNFKFNKNLIKNKAAKNGLAASDLGTTLF
jgi:hypothetical protein